MFNFSEWKRTKQCRKRYVLSWILTQLFTSGLDICSSLCSQASSPNNYRTVNLISKEDFERITPPTRKVSNPEAPPPPPGSHSISDEGVFLMEEDSKSPKDAPSSSAAQKSVRTNFYIINSVGDRFIIWLGRTSEEFICLTP